MIFLLFIIPIGIVLSFILQRKIKQDGIFMSNKWISEQKYQYKKDRGVSEK